MVGARLVLALAVGGLLLARRFRIWELSRVTIDEAAAQRASVELLEYVKQKSYEPGRLVDLRPFWRGRRLTSADRKIIEGPLLASEVLLIMRQTGALNDVVDKIIDWAFAPLPERVVLNPQEWHRMTHGGS